MGDETDTEIEVDYWPLLRASLAAAVVALLSQVFGVVWFGLQAGARIEIDRFLIFPFLRVITTDVHVFNSIIKWSTLATALAVTVFAVSAFVRHRRLQTQMGRSFGFLDLAILAGLHLWGERISPGSTLPTRLMVYAFAFGLIGYFLSTFLVVDSYRMRRDGATEGPVVDPDLVTAS